VKFLLDTSNNLPRSNQSQVHNSLSVNKDNFSVTSNDVRQLEAILLLFHTLAVGKFDISLEGKCRLLVGKLLAFEAWTLKKKVVIQILFHVACYSFI
jgi:hypothetical protein